MPIWLRTRPSARALVLRPAAGDLFLPQYVDGTVKALLEGQKPDKRDETKHKSAQQRLAAAEEELKRFQNAIKAGVDPAALVEAVNEAQDKRAVAQAELVDVPTARGFRIGLIDRGSMRPSRR